MALKKPHAAKRVGPRSGFVKLTASVTTQQYDAVILEAVKRAEAAGQFRADASVVVREALDLWLRSRKG
ncbi:hypothetical protein [Anaeromyxobacter diazotrophicus]|uniref:Uncharacterized protein n=1 Tax=Anaeromyxobacter diazotrophicus TaxID=2590199 RepID=A0A7I9VKK7_9BACT|nr:hypothetical protein [Anaeromyxobacter diazotrophicus]GEJ56933.1 hypothetical protein AMYX_16740 [Anaeromyxobacter diazotrophicus]